MAEQLALFPVEEIAPRTDTARGLSAPLRAANRVPRRVRSPLRYYGGKQYLAGRVVAHLPPRRVYDGGTQAEGYRGAVD